jgi:predicted AAA+ superfamily ATPase
MTVSNRDRVGKAMDLLKDGLNPYVARELQAALGRAWWTKVGDYRDEPRDQDVTALLGLMLDQWPAVFGRKLGTFERNLAHELRHFRNRWAHQEPFSADDTYRALDSAGRMLAAVAAANQAAEVEREKQEFQRLRLEEQSRKDTRKAAVAPLEGRPAGGLKPWREVVTPHPDVASGRYQQAEFMADLGQVARGEGSDEYREPAEFFRRTFLTDGLRQMLIDALERLAGTGGDPVVKLQTNFGGGKTHAMLALYHLFSGAPAEGLPGVEEVLQRAGVARPPKANIAVLVGQALDPATPRRKEDGTETRTLWGELAWQLGGKDGYSLVAEADARGVSPGTDALRDLFELFAPCLVLIDEWVAYARQLYGVDGLPAGAFDANLSFAQALTEAARQASQTLVVATIPASDIETGGEAGRQARTLLENVFGRVESTWRPASADEGFEIVRRRLFQQVGDPRLLADRDGVVRAFSDLYGTQTSEFPTGSREAAYERRMKLAYPIHPELFDRLYNDWASLERFQRTRGVLRLMAAVIHALWERQDGGLLILPASVPIDDGRVQYELTRYLDDNWVPVIEKDVDGPNSLPLGIDRDNPNLGRFSAARRIARTLYLGSAPTQRAANLGLEDRQVKLGCVQPGESPAVFGDALRRLTDQATYLYVDGRRYWYATQPSVTRTAQDRAEQLPGDKVEEEIRGRLAAQQNQRGDFARVYPCPRSHADVPDEREARLVIFGPEFEHVGKAADSPARKQAAATLDQRGTSPRLFRNALIFLAPDRARLAELEQAVRGFLAWKSIHDEKDALNLDAFQAGQAESKRKQWDDTVRQRVPEAFQWLLVPTQDAQGPVEWQEIRLQGDEALAVRASRRLRNEGLLITTYGATLLRRDLDRIPLWRGDHVEVRQLWDDYAQYLYLARLRDSEVLLRAVQEGAQMLTWETDTFAYAEGFDEKAGRYLGLRTATTGSVTLEGHALVVKAAAARRQLEEDFPPPPSPIKNGDDDVFPPPPPPPPPPTPRLRRFHGSVTIGDPVRLTREAASISEAVVQHLAGLANAGVRITVEISADLPDGAPDAVVRTVTENCRTLRFSSFGFEEG